MKKKLIGLSGSVLSFGLPFVALAQNKAGCADALARAGNANTLQSIICKIGNVLDIVIPILIVLGVLYFVFGVVQYVIADDEKAKAKGRDRMIFGIIGLFVIVALWGLVHVVKNTFNIGQENILPGDIPTVPL